MTALSLAFAPLSFARPAAAQSAESQAAEALFKQARSLMDEGELEAACEKFAASQALEPGLGTLLYLGDCYERAGRFASALTTFRDAAELAEERGDAARLRLARVRVSALEPRAPKLEIRPAAQPQRLDLQVTVGGIPLGPAELGRPLARDAGRYEIRFSAPGYEPFVSHIELRNAGSVVVTVPHLVPLSGVAAARGAESPAGREEPGSSQRTAAWIVGGAGVGLLGAAAVLGALAAGKNGDSKGNCDADDPTRCGLAGVEQREDAQSLATAATIASIIGAVGVASGVVLFVSAPDTEDPLGRAAIVSVSGAF